MVFCSCRYRREGHRQVDGRSGKFGVGRVRVISPSFDSFHRPLSFRRII
jgi:hypothetical protein